MVNIEFSLIIRGMKDERERAGMTGSLTNMLESLGLARDVFITLGENGTNLFVRTESVYPAVSSGYRWLDDFEAGLTHCATTVVPHAQTVLSTVDADGEPDDFDNGGQVLGVCRSGALPAEVPVVHRNSTMDAGARELTTVTLDLLNYWLNLLCYLRANRSWRSADLITGTLVGRDHRIQYRRTAGSLLSPACWAWSRMPPQDSMIRIDARLVASQVRRIRLMPRRRATGMLWWRMARP
jgi:hypothetical protein